MSDLFSLGDLYVSDFLGPNDLPRGGKSELALTLTEDGNVRLTKTAPLDTMFGKYWYRSGTNLSMTQALKDVVDSITSVIKLQKGDIWLDVACNDGTLLGFVPDNLVRIGVDPADDSYKRESEKHADLIIQDYFTARAFQDSKFGASKVKVLTSIAMFYDLVDPDTFVEDVKAVLDNNGLWVLQLSYTPLMLQQLAFDNILHEHVFYYSLCNLQALLTKHGFQLLDCQLNDVNGGSFRVYAMKAEADTTSFATQPYRDVCHFRLQALLEYERTLRLDAVETWQRFFDRINALKQQTVGFIQAERSKGKTIWGYGASTKGNTLLQYFGLDHSLIDGIAERSPYKFGLHTVGTNVPIHSEEEMRQAKPDYLLVLPWHFIDEFLKREADLLNHGTKFIVPCPRFEVIGSDHNTQWRSYL